MLAAFINPNLCTTRMHGSLPPLQSGKPYGSAFLPKMPRVLKTQVPGTGYGGRRVADVTASLAERSSNSFDSEAWQKDFEKRFELPHLTDLLDIKPIQTTFCIKSSCPLPEDAVEYPPGDLGKMFVHNDDRVLLKVIKYATPSSAGAECVDPDCNFVHQWVHRAGPRPEIYFNPNEVKAAIVTCGGLCPGLNDVIRQIVITLEIYGVKNIVGISYGYRGLFDEHLPEIKLSRKVVQGVHLSGGSILGVSRGGGNVPDIVDSI